MNEYRGLMLLAAWLRDDAVAALPEWLGRVDDWQAVALIASGHGVSPALYPALDRSGVLAQLPPDFRDYLEGLWQLNRQRNRELLAQVLEVDALLAAVGSQPIFMKGVASLAAGLYPDPAQRLISDIDVLLPEPELDRARAALLRAGYRPDPASPELEAYQGLHQDPPLFHPQRPAPVELHRRPLLARRCGLLLQRLGGIATREATLHGRPLRLLTPTQRLAQTFLHLMVQDSAYVWANFNLRQLHEAHRLVQAERSRIDWPELQDAAAASRCRGEWCAFAVALNRLFATGLDLSPRERTLGELWYARACAYARWPQVRAAHRAAYQQVKRWTPLAVKRRLGLTDYGWSKPPQFERR